MVKKAAQATPNKLLRAARKERGWSQQLVADRIRAPFSVNISRWENGTAFPSPYYIEKLCDLFGKSVAELGLIQLDNQTPENTAQNFDQGRERTDILLLRQSTLPLPLTPFIGRQKEALRVQALLQRPEVRLLTLAGAGGIGKTRLALHVCTHLKEDFPDGIFFVSLAPLSDPGLVLATIAQMLGLKESAASPLSLLLKRYLEDKRLLLLLDSFERLLPSALDLCALLALCPQLKILVTSRAVLHVQAEYEFAVSALSLPNLEALPPAEILAQYEAVELFVQRAQAVKADFCLREANARMVAEICVRLDGLPLALELAAARLNLLSPQELLTRLSSRLAVLTGGPQDLPGRQRTLRDTILWSYHLLGEQERCLLRRLSVFSGGCTLSALEAIYTDLDESLSPQRLLLDVSSLRDNSLLQVMQQEGKESRLYLLETIREYGLECLEASGELEATQAAHASYCLQFGREADSKLDGREQREWLPRLEQEQENLRAALNWALEKRRSELVLRLVTSLRRFWGIRGYLGEGRAFLERALLQVDEVDGSVLTRALLEAGHHANLQGDFEQAKVWGKQSVLLSREKQDSEAIADALLLLGNVAMQRGEHTQARLLLEEALAHKRARGDILGQSYGLLSLASVLVNMGDYDLAYTLLEESLAYSRREEFLPGMATGLDLQARIHFYQGDLTKAHPLLEESLALSRQVGYQNGIASALMLLGLLHLVQADLGAARPLLSEGLSLSDKGGWQEGRVWGIYGLGWVEHREGNYERAHLYFEEGLSLCQRLGNLVFTTFYLEGLSNTVAMQGHLTWATRLWGAAERLRERIGAAVPLFMQLPYEQFVSGLRLQLGEEAFTPLREQGRMMTLDQISGEKKRLSFPPISGNT